MKPLAIFDIGSNTLLMTIGYLKDASLKIIYDEGDVVRMGEGLSDSGPLQEAAKIRVLTALKNFKQEAQQRGVQDFLAAGTAAFRRACDGKAFADKIVRDLAIPVRILKGEEEAHYSYLSACLDFKKLSQPLGMIDIGGGSTEFVFSEQPPYFSLPIGTVRFSEALQIQHPISDAQWTSLRETIRSILQSELDLQKIPAMPWVAVAATPASLAAVLLGLPQYDPKKIHGYLLTLDALNNLAETLRNSSIEVRCAMPGMHPKRAELLPIGAAILLESMLALNLSQITVSDHGLRYGILWEMLQQKQKK